MSGKVQHADPFSKVIPTTPITSYLTLQLKSVGFGTFETNLLTIPAYVLFIINLLFFSWLSEKLNERFLLATISQWWALALLISLEVLPADRNPWVAWVLSVLLYAMPYFHAVLVAVTSRNAGSVRTRTVGVFSSTEDEANFANRYIASAIYNMCVQASNIIGNNVSTKCPCQKHQDADWHDRYTGKTTNLFTTEVTRSSSPSYAGISRYSSLLRSFTSLSTGQ